MIIAITNVKGGVGKSTLALHFAYLLSRVLDYRQVLLLDADKQASVWSWSQVRSDDDRLSVVRCQPLGKQGVRPLLLREKEANAVVIIDVGGEDSSVARAVAATADVVVIPSQISSMDHSGNKVILSLVEEAMSYNPDLKVCMIWNRISTSTKESEEIEQLRQLYPAFVRWPQASAKGFALVHDRVAFRRTTLEGFTVFDAVAEDHSRDVKAQYDIAKTLMNILSCCGYDALAKLVGDQVIDPLVKGATKEETKYFNRFEGGSSDE